MNFNKLSLEEKFGQMLILGLDVYEINEEIIELIQKYKIGGVIIYKKNYTSLETMIEVINKLKKINEKNKIPLFIGIDQENGLVNRFPKDITPITSAYKQAKTRNMKVIDTINKLTTYLLLSTGVNVNFAPVLDVNLNNKNKKIGSRSYGTNAEEVIKYGLPFMKELQNNNILSVIKHFPCVGAANRDNLFVIPKINDIEKLNENLKVFEEAIKKGADAIMVSHLKIKGYGLKPASLNKKIIKELLIDKYHFNGILIADDLKNCALRKFHSVQKSVKKSIEAGNNAVIIKYKKGDIARIYKELFKLVRHCEIDPELINNSAKKIVTMKNKYDISNNLITSKVEVDLVNKKIKNINNEINKELGINLT